MFTNYIYSYKEKHFPLRIICNDKQQIQEQYNNFINKNKINHFIGRNVLRLEI